MKQAEIEYLRNAGSDFSEGAQNKPFSESQCAKNLAAMSVILSLLPTRPTKVLDLGCGSGWTSWFMAKNGHIVVGQDISPDMIELANKNRERFGASSASFLLSDYESLDLAESFDVALFYDSLHHAEDPISAIECAFKALRPNGLLITHEPGAGHASHPASIAAMEKWGVTERDMPPSLIFKMGRQVGFRECRRLIDPTAVFKCVYSLNIDEQVTIPGFVAKIRAFVSLIRIAMDPNQGAICVLTK